MKEKKKNDRGEQKKRDGQENEKKKKKDDRKKKKKKDNENPLGLQFLCLVEQHCLAPLLRVHGRFSRLLLLLHLRSLRGQFLHLKSSEIEERKADVDQKKN